ncbi:histidine phosphatase family protein [Acetobacter orientalis]|uniref:Phosphoglycerate mutase n=2 Tax=Acetobacter orientalis TaxID=146474 RepID=A0A2Z5ZG21_9PROT|nr:histidine phosphatase family protein [Acetobacter orientalis]BBC79315.1 phosphoglycerate mutase [Acetobacter orientalis]GAN65410.1 phosphoglycerate mutase [Acetobacter orientalis]GBR18513.1 phosphoglycerate mutase [Acetobacter orientalis NRIC 0481]GEL62534.1 hypothetical protein AOR02nite_23760 [Acetobacter orientalis]
MIILRHCESEFNRLYTQTGRDPNLADPALSAAGQAQAQNLVSQLAGLPITRIVVSPFTRALQTAAPLARVLNLTPQITPVIRERGLYSCDEGSCPTTLQAAWPQLDFSALSQRWWSEQPEPDHHMQHRVQTFLASMRQSPDSGQTLVVSHWWFLLGLCGDSLENGEWRHYPL